MPHVKRKIADIAGWARKASSVCFLGEREWLKKKRITKETLTGNSPTEKAKALMHA